MRERLVPVLCVPGPEDDLLVDPTHRRIVFVVGPGRSGTSTMAGALAHSGYTVPQAIMGNETNPQGFFEPRWVVNFHRQHLDRLGVRTLDTDPGVLERMDALTRDEAIRDELRAWLTERLEAHDRLVVKDPRMVWFRDLWVSVTQELGVDPAFVIMLRHPSEVSSSRNEYYNVNEVTGVAGWVNVALITEKLTRGSSRSLVRYVNLTSDWRAELTRVRDQLGLDLDPPPEHRPHPVDDFIDPTLRRRKQGWENTTVPEHLQDIGDRTFDTLGAIADAGESTECDSQLTRLREEYARIHDDSLALVNASVKRMRTETQRRTARRVRTNSRRLLDAQLKEQTSGAWGGLRAVARRLRRGGTP
jgi:hypothetical protein